MRVGIMKSRPSEWFAKTRRLSADFFVEDIKVRDFLDEKINHFGKTLVVGHWHNDMPGLENDKQILAFSKGCPRQIVKYSDIVYGFQCHMELTKQVVKKLWSFLNHPGP